MPRSARSCRRSQRVIGAKTPTGWEGRVVRPVLDMKDEKWRPREEWLPAENLAPAES